ncbi:MAG: hypothetical protein ABIS49_08570 [Aestuariivirga sp.]
MHLRFGKPGIALLVGLLLAAGSRVAIADDNKDHHGSDHDHSTSSDSGNSDNGGKPAGGDNSGGKHNNDDEQSQVSQTNPESNAHEADETPEREQEEARQAVASGKAAPLTSLLRKLRSDYPGQVLDVSLAQHFSRLVFVVKYIDKTGLVKVVSLDAVTLEDD